MMRWTRSLTLGAFAAVLGSTFAGCSANEKAAPGALMIAVQTDLVAPKDVSAVGLFISSDGKPVFSDTRDTAPNGEVHFPATIAVIADENRPGAVIKIRAVAFTSDARVRVLRDAITTVPRGRTALLRMPLLWINDGSGTGSRADTLAAASVRPLDNSLDVLSNVQSTCTDPTQTYVDGECRDANVDSSALVDYHEEEIFGGGHADGTDGSCFDVKACFASAVPLTLAADCSAVLPQGFRADDPNLSLAIALKQAPSGAAASTGECLGNGACLVPLDQGTSFTSSGNTVHLPAAVCKRIAENVALGVVASRACAAKTDAQPACGPASAVSSDHPISPEGGATEAGAFDFDAGAPSDAATEDAAPLPGEDAAVDGSIVVDAGSDADAAATLDAGDASSDAAVDAGDAGVVGDGGVVGPEFGPVTDYTIGEPDPTGLEFDGQRLYVARANNGPLEANVVSFALSDLLANPSNAAFPRSVHFSPTDSVGSTAPLFDVTYASNVPVRLVGAFGQAAPWKFMNCALGGAGCATTGQLPTEPSPFAARAIALTPNRLYVANTNTADINYYDYGTTSWSAFTLPTSYQVTAIHYILGANTLVVGLASGEIYRCVDAPCSATNGAWYTIAPTPGAVTAIADDGANMFWATTGQGLFKENATAPILLAAGPLVDTNTTSLSVDAKYIYFGAATTLNGALLDGSAPTTPLSIAVAPSNITSVVSANDEVFFTASPNTLRAACKRYLNPNCK